MENLFEKLMEQIKMPSQIRESALFSTAEIENVEVHTERKLWKFQLKFEKIIPVEQWKILSGLIESAFSNIAETELSIDVKEPAFDEQVLNDYYQVALTLHPSCRGPWSVHTCLFSIPMYSGLAWGLSRC